MFGPVVLNNFYKLEENHAKSSIKCENPSKKGNFRQKKGGEEKAKKLQKSSDSNKNAKKASTTKMRRRL